MKPARHWEPYKEKESGKKDIVQCRLCPHNCVIAEGKRGICRVRENREGKLYAMSYGKAVSLNVDPIEKKPLFHFMPGTESLSFGTAGCNMRCGHCQNWEISQAKPEDFPTPETRPADIIKRAKQKGCKSISYTYTEPTIFYEYVYDTAMLARDEGIKNIMVSNGYIEKKPLLELYPLIEAANIDLKGFNEEFYAKQCGAKLKPVLEALKMIKKTGTWLEITNLIIPTKNDDMEEIREMCDWIAGNLGKDVPLHFSRFFPMYKNLDLPPTPVETIVKAKDVAVRAGLHYVYIGNVVTEKDENTYCPKCKKLLVGRSGFGVVSNNIRDGKCIYCREKIAGVWKGDEDEIA
ncbi:AmmeMemoRadiSam system radical SAM enzyme [Candidatus Woesearchaeota archaeon CG10_big_fil_rev_8_21_14_0_10_44_13]|nr:MAG: AmmeMemoRadiSam system radical SAM enzyme [Candidatus Woesearchaeota archaeon CG10_big_fil_rev_8_21_14_0_10_44_13]